MNIVIDTSIVIAVITNESHKRQIINMTQGADLIAPSSLHWELGNAFSAMFKRDRITLKQAKEALNSYKQIPIRFVDIDINKALEIANDQNIYAYDAYFVACADKFNTSLLSLDKGLLEAARKSDIDVREVPL